MREWAVVLFAPPFLVKVVMARSVLLWQFLPGRGFSIERGQFCHQQLLFLAFLVALPPHTAKLEVTGRNSLAQVHTAAQIASPVM